MAQSNQDGFGAIFIKATCNGVDISSKIQHFEYSYEEEGEDLAEIKIMSDDVTEPDKDIYYHKARWQIVWGYINAEVSEIRTVYVQDVQWDFSKDAVCGTILATEKGITLKFEDEETNYQNTTLAEIVQDKATKHGLEAWLEAPSSDDLPVFKLPVQPGDHNSLDYVSRNATATILQHTDSINAPANRVSLNAYLKTAVAADQANTQSQQAVQGFVIRGDGFIQGPGGSEGPGAFKFRQISNQPQANDTDASLLDKLASKEPGGPFFLDTRDDDITLKKRNFNQVPFKSYEYGGSNGELQQFKPMSRIRSHKKSSTNVGFSGWNAADKTAYSGNANGLYDSDPKLVEYKRVYRFLKKLSVVPGTTPDISGGTLTWSVQLLKTENNGQLGGGAGNPNYINQADVSSNHNQGALFIPFTVNDALAALQASLVEGEKALDNNTYDPTQLNADDAVNRAMNERRNQELKMNPASAEMWGEPKLKVGQILTFTHVSKKYTGNYYTIKVKHTLSKSGYTTTTEMVTQGYNLPIGKEWEKVKFGKINKVMGNKNPTYIKVIQTKQNPGN